MDKFRKWYRIAFIPWAVGMTLFYTISGRVVPGEGQDWLTVSLVVLLPAGAVLAACTLHLERYAATARKYINTLEQVILQKAVPMISAEEVKKLFEDGEDK